MEKATNDGIFRSKQCHAQLGKASQTALTPCHLLCVCVSPAISLVSGTVDYTVKDSKGVRLPDHPKTVNYVFTSPPMAQSERHHGAAKVPFAHC